jgi:hypothetical protein
MFNSSFLENDALLHTLHPDNLSRAPLYFSATTLKIPSLHAHRADVRRNPILEPKTRQRLSQFCCQRVGRGNAPALKVAEEKRETAAIFVAHTARVSRRGRGALRLEVYCGIIVGERIESSILHASID